MSLLRQTLVIVVLAAIAAGGYAFQTGYWASSGSSDAVANGGSGGKSRHDRASPVLVAQVKTEIFQKSVEAVGTTRALQSVDIVPSSSGRIRALSIEPGQIVQAGTVLAKLDDEIQQADFSEATAKLEEANTALKRADKLFRQRNIAEARVIELRAKLAIAKADLARARRRLDDRTVRAPFSGRTGLRQVDIGARVDTDTMLTTLDDISSIEIEARLPESLFPTTRKGAVVSAQSAAFPGRTFSGTVAAIDKRIDPVGRAFKVRVRVPNSDGALPAGMFMRLTVRMDRRENPAIPEESLVVQGDRKFVFLVDGNGESVTQATVEIGQRRNGLVEIIDGVKAGDTVVTEGTHRLKDGSKVSVQSISPGQHSSTPPSTAALQGAEQQPVDKKDGS